MNPFKWLFRYTLNSVIFGIATMALVASYIAIGSGVPAVRETFEMNDMEFFNAWPLKVLMLLLVLNLITVTWTRIPLTLPRLGVWMIHTGIIVLIIGTSLYYRFKVEGQIPIRRGQTVTGYYDAAERSLFVRIDGRPISTTLPLADLPRFKSYPANLDAAPLDRDLANLPLIGWFAGDKGQPVQRSLGKLLGMSGEITVDIVGYHPYATIASDYVEHPEGTLAGVRLSTPDPHSTGTGNESWLVASDPKDRATDFGGIVIEHRHLPTNSVAVMTESATQMHRLDVQAGDYTQSLFVQVGQTYELGASGYSFTVENFNPSFPMSGTGEMVRVLTLLVKNTKPGGVAEFRRMVIDGKPLQTDFKLNEPGAGPMGKRQKEPLDNTLQIGYAFNDLYRLMTFDGSERHLLITGDGPAIGHLMIHRDGAVKNLPLTPAGEFFVGPEKVQLKLTASKSEKLKRVERVVDVPSEKRIRDVGATGIAQVVTARVRCGDWSQIVNLPYVSFAMEPGAGWNEARPIDLPGTTSKLQIGLGNTRRTLPAKLTLEKFELVNYPGGTINENLFRDFKSTLKIVSNATGKEQVGMAHMNSPIYFAGGDWLFFQAAFNKEDMSTVMGIGNRPGVRVMTFGCVLMTIGLMWAFYLKPVIIRKRKEKALAKAHADGRLAKTVKAREPARETVPAE